MYSAQPALVKATHYEGDDGWYSDTGKLLYIVYVLTSSGNVVYNYNTLLIIIIIYL